MYQHVCLLSTLLNEVVGRLECVPGVLSVAVVEVENKMFEMFGVIEVEIDS